MDMWNYQEIIHEHNIQWIIETGTRHGGSGLFFADLLHARNAAGNVISVDLMPAVPADFPGHEKLDLLTGDSGSEEMANTIKDMLPQERGTLLMILDSDHSAKHVYRELNVLVTLLRKDDYLIVEDTIVNGHPVRPDHGPGPMEGMQQYVSENPDVLMPDAKRSQRFGASFADKGYFIKT
jgi:cephalosporin hydroxylase